MESKFTSSNGINLHYLESKGIDNDKQTIIFLHGVSANAHAFDGLIKEGLNQNYTIISLDMRGRGLSDKPATGYDMKEHAKDVLGLLDHLGIEKAILAGHSFGALLSIYMSYHYPEKIDKIILLDAAAKLHPDTREMLIPSLSRLGQTYPSFENYLDKIKKSPYITFWDESMESYYKADIQENSDGSVTPRSSVENISETLNKASFGETWQTYITEISQPAILMNGTANYALEAPILPKEYALETVNAMKNCQYLEVSGNHQTMLYGQGAKEIVQAITKFLDKK
ncbi:alpha/beta hydrolase [bacterium]|nr:MAG: alpha/beta hydrolase [bacterium]